MLPDEVTGQGVNAEFTRPHRRKLFVRQRRYDESVANVDVELVARTPTARVAAESPEQPGGLPVRRLASPSV